MSDQRQDVVDTSSMIALDWATIRPSVQTFVGCVNGAAAFLVATSFGWNYAHWTTGVWISCLSCLVAGVVTAIQLARGKWQSAFLSGILIGLIIDVGGGFAVRDSAALMVVTAFALLVASGLALPYQLRGDVTDGCVANLRFLSVISVVGIILFLIVTASVAGARNAASIFDVLICSFGTMLAQVWFTRYAQAQSTHLSSKTLRYSVSGILALGEWFRTLGPLLKSFIRFLIVLAIMLAVTPFIIQLAAHFHPHRKAMNQQQTLQQQPNPQKFLESQPHPSSHSYAWMIWAAALIVLFTVALIWFLRRQQAQTPSRNTASDGLGPIQITRDHHAHPFRLVKTDDPVRKAYQKRLQKWHHDGYTIERFESVQSFLKRIPRAPLGAGDDESDESLTEKYERARYGAKPEDDANAMHDKHQEP